MGAVIRLLATRDPAAWQLSRRGMCAQALDAFGRCRPGRVPGLSDRVPMSLSSACPRGVYWGVRHGQADSPGSLITPSAGALWAGLAD